MRLLPFLFASLIFSNSLVAADYNFTFSGGKWYVTVKGADGKPQYKEVTVEINNLDTSSPQPPTNPKPPTNPNPPTTPTEPNDPFEKEIAKITEQVLKNGGSKTTAAGISSAFSLVADEVLSGGIVLEKAIPAVQRALATVINLQPDKDKWNKWRVDVSSSLQTLQQEGAFNTKEKCAAVLKSVASGMNSVSGYNGDTKNPQELKSARSQGILGNIDIERLIEIIKFIMELMKIFMGGF